MTPMVILSFAPAAFLPASSSTAAITSRAYHSGKPAAPRAVSDARMKPRREKLPRFMRLLLRRRVSGGSERVSYQRAFAGVSYQPGKISLSKLISHRLPPDAIPRGTVQSVGGEETASCWDETAC